MGKRNQVSKFVHASLLDRFIGVFFPRTAALRLRSKAQFNFMSSGGYVTPGSAKRTMRGWNASSGSADYDTLPKLDRMRKGSRDLSMNTPMALAPLRRESLNAIGWGLMFQSNIDRNFLGLSDEEADAWERNVEREFKLWATSKNCDATRTLCFAELQTLVLYNTSLSGEVFVTLPYIQRPNHPYALSVQVLEADYVCNPNFKLDTNTLAGGIEIDKHGAPVKYWFRIPNNAFLDSGNTTVSKFVGIPAFGPRSGRRNVFHLYHKERPGQRRGIPMLAPLLEVLKQCSRLTEAELNAAVVNSFFTVFVKTDPVSGGLESGYIPEESLTEKQNLPGDEKVYELGPATINELDEGQSIEMADPKRPNDAFEPFFNSLMKQIGASIGIPFEQLLLYFQASYSAARAAILEAWKFYRVRRKWVGRNFCQPIFEEWLTEAVIRGRIKAPGFFNDPIIRMAWCGAKWIGPGQGQIDPLKETKAAVERLNNHLSNYDTEFSNIHGEDWEGSVDRRKREEEYLKEKGLSSNVPIENEDDLSSEVTTQIEDNTDE